MITTREGGWSITGSGVERIGTVGLCLFLLFAWLGNALAYLGLVLMLLAFLILLPEKWRMLIRDPVIILFVIFCAYLLLRTLWAIQEFPELTELHIENGIKFLQLWLFILIGWWLRQRPRLFYAGLLMVLVGYLLSVIKLTDWQSCQGFLDGNRCGFGFQMIMGALLAGSALLGLLMFAPRLIGTFKLHWSWFIRIAIWFVVLIAIVQIVISTQTRSVWLGILFVYPVVLIMRYWEDIRSAMKGGGRKGLMAGLMLLLSIAAVVYSNKGVIEQRFSKIEDNIFAIALMQFDQVDVGAASVSIRMYLNRNGIEKWLERPVFGWGTGVNVTAVFPEVREKAGHMEHLHNTYLEILARFGLVGAIILFMTLAYICRGVFRAYRYGEIERDLFYFHCGIAGLFAIWCFTDYQLAYTDFRFYCYIAAGIAYASMIDRRRTA